MPSPFPGMDPWLESPRLWPGFHDILIVLTVNELKESLRQQGYYATAGERVWLTEPMRPIYPDVTMIHRPTVPTAREVSSVAVVEPDEPILIRGTEVEVHEGVVEIYEIGGEQIITGIEFLSPANKSDPHGRELYQRKQRETREAGIHLVEVDLLREGPHVLELPDTLLDALGPWDYLVNLARRGAHEYAVYPISLRNRLPRIRIPLKAGDEDAVLDLQRVFERSYDMGPYPDSINYSNDPTPPLSDEDRGWAGQLLKEQGFRT